MTKTDHCNIQLGKTVVVGKFKQKTVSCIDGKIPFLRLHNTYLTQVQTSQKGKELVQVRINDTDKHKLILFETKIRQTLKNELPASKVKSEVRDNLVTLSLIKARGQLQTEFLDSRDNQTTIAEVQIGRTATIDIKCDTIWSRNDYYPSFLYKWKIVSIRMEK